MHRNGDGNDGWLVLPTSNGDSSGRGGWLFCLPGMETAPVLDGMWLLAGKKGSKGGGWWLASNGDHHGVGWLLPSNGDSHGSRLLLPSNGSSHGGGCLLLMSGKSN